MKYFRIDKGLKSRGVGWLCHFGKKLTKTSTIDDREWVFSTKQLRDNCQLYVMLDEEPYSLKDVISQAIHLVVSSKVYDLLPKDKFKSFCFEQVELCEYIDDENIPIVETDADSYYALLPCAEIEGIKVMDDELSQFVDLAGIRMMKKWVLDSRLELSDWAYSTKYSGTVVSESFVKFLDENGFDGLGLKANDED